MNNKYILTVFVCLFVNLLASGQDTTEVDVCEEAGYFLSFVATPPDCFGTATGNATVASPGCSCMFSGCTFEWNIDQEFHTIVGLEAGIYSVTVNHPNGCVLSGDIEVPEAEQYVEDFEVAPILCKGASDGRIRINPTPDFNGLLTYQWSNGATTREVENLAPGEYSVTVTQFNGCSMTEIFTIDEPESSLDFIYETVATCENIDYGVIVLDVEGGKPPYQHFCDGVAREELVLSNLSAGPHIIKIIDSNLCEVEKEVVIEGLEVAVPQINITESTICQGSMTNLSVFMGGGFEYEWSPTTGLSNPYSNVLTAAPEQTTVYTLTATDNQQCKVTAEVEVKVNICESEDTLGTDIVGLEDNLLTQKVKVYPNPSSHFINIASDLVLNNAVVEIIDLSGRTLLSFNQIPNQAVDVSLLNEGIYFLSIQSDEGSMVEKIIKN